MNRTTQTGNHILSSSTTPSFIKWFADIAISDIPLVGGKNASLGEMVRELTDRGVKVPDGFAITAEAYRHFPNEGVGLARMEFIITTYIKIHPLALVDFERLDDLAVKAEIERLTTGYTDKSQFFVDRLALGVGMLAAAFYPKDVILRLSDFKTNEYANLIGGKAYEPSQENPMLGFRGASRYYHPRYQAGFELECRAAKKVRDEMGLTHLKLMIPFCRTPARRSDT